MAKQIDNDAANSTPAKTYKERLEQALLWATYELGCDQSGHGGLEIAIDDLLPDFNTQKLIDKGYTIVCPDSYSDDE